jgi:hypothetical protein
MGREATPLFISKQGLLRSPSGMNPLATKASHNPAAFSRAACSTNNRTGSAPFPTSPSD